MIPRTLLLITLTLLLTNFTFAAPTTSPDLESLATTTADRFAHAVDHADVTAATAECSLPFLNSFNQLAPDADALKKSLDMYTQFPRKNPEAGLYYRGVNASLPYDQYRQRLETIPKDPRQPLDNLDALKLTASDRVVLVNWMMNYSVLIRIRDGKATVAGLGPALPQDAFLTRLIADNRPYRQVRDIVYGRRFGTALTLDVLTPTHGSNGAAVLYLLSGDFVSKPMPESDNWVLQPFLSHGYTVITVVHSTVPKYTIAEIVRDIYRAARFTRFHARDYNIDPQRIGVTGSSSGAYLALMLATARIIEPPLSDGSDPLGAPDEIDAVSCRVQAVACFFPPTDWLNYGEKDKSVLDLKWPGPQIKSIFEFRDFDPARFAYTPITDRAQINDLLSAHSPARRVTKETAPTLILHGEKDPTVPLQQSQLFIDKLKETGVPAQLIIKPNAGHGWPDQTRDIDQVIQWFDTQLIH